MGCCTAIESATNDSSDVCVLLVLAVCVTTISLVCANFAAAVESSAESSKVTEPFVDCRPFANPFYGTAPIRSQVHLRPVVLAELAGI